MNNVYQVAENCLYDNGNVDSLLTLTHQAKQKDNSHLLTFEDNSPVLAISGVRFPDKPVLLSPRHMPKRNLGSKAGVIAFFHAIAHVEFMAIYLAWDLLYRFRSLPLQFYQDWLAIADEEAQHFELIRQYLRTFDVDYGDLPAHGGLWDHAVATADDLLARLALVPRCMEARGLDVTPSIIARFTEFRNDQAVSILNRILADEIMHVERGSYWFNRFCVEVKLNPEQHFQAMVNKYYLGGKPKGPFNREKRKIAGFSDAELDWLEAH